MMKKLVLLVLVMGMASCSFGPKPINEMTEAEINQEVFVYSGVGSNIQTVSQGIPAALSQKQQKSKIDPRFYEILQTSLSKNFSHQNLVKPIQKAIYKMSLKDKKKILSFYRTQTGRYVYGLEQYVSTPQGQVQFQQWLAHMKKNKLSPSKEDLQYAALVSKYSGATEATTETLMAVTSGMMIGVNSTLPKKKQMPVWKLKKNLKKIKGTISKSMEPIVVLTMHYTYKGLKPEMKNQYLQFLKKGVGKKFVKVVAKSLHKSFEIASKGVGKDIARGIASYKK
jgi:hypothetical protein